MPESPNIFVLVAALVDAIGQDENQSGGLLSRATLRKADECRLALSRLRAVHGELAALDIVPAPIEEKPHA